MTHTLSQIESSWKKTNSVRVMCKLHFPIKNYGNRKRREKKFTVCLNLLRFIAADSEYGLYKRQIASCFQALLFVSQQEISDFFLSGFNLFCLADPLQL